MDRRGFLACLGIGAVAPLAPRTLDYLEGKTETAPCSFRSMMNVNTLDPQKFKGYGIVICLDGEKDFVTVPINKIVEYGTLDNMEGYQRRYWVTLPVEEEFDLKHDAHLAGIVDKNNQLVVAFRANFFSQYHFNVGDTFHVSYALSMGNCLDYSKLPETIHLL